LRRFLYVRRYTFSGTVAIALKVLQDAAKGTAHATSPSINFLVHPSLGVAGFQEIAARPDAIERRNLMRKDSVAPG
jgi:hypothetical protein